MTQPTVRCIEFVDLFTDWTESALSDDMRAEVEEHLALCVTCMAYVDGLRLTQRLLRASAEAAPPSEVRQVLVEAFRARHTHQER